MRSTWRRGYLGWLAAGWLFLLGAASACGYGPVHDHTDVRGLTVTRYWDGLGRLTGQRFSDDGTTTTNLCGLPSTNVIAANSGTTNNLERTLHRDRLGRITLFGYDPGGKLRTNYLGTASPANVLEVFAYDAASRLTNMVDGTGMTRFAYTDGLPTLEDGPWAADEVVSTYNNAALPQTSSVSRASGSPWSVTLGWDAASRLRTVQSPAGQHTYNYFAQRGGVTSAASLVERIDPPNGSRITKAFDSVARLTATEFRKSDGSMLDGHGYPVLDDANRRLKQTRTHAGVTTSIDFGYDALGQLTGASGKEPNGTTLRPHEQFGYGYDPKGNLTRRTNNALVVAFLPESRNRLVSATASGSLTVAASTVGGATSVTVNTVAATGLSDGTFVRTSVGLPNGTTNFTAIAEDAAGRRDTNSVTVWLPNAATFAYDASGNLTNDGRRSFSYDAYDRLESVQVSGAWRTEFVHDGLTRLRVRTEFTWSGGTWVTNAVVRYVYAGGLVVEERNGSNNATTVAYTRGLDLSGSLGGAGGIGGLLALTRYDTASPSHAWYHADGSGNVTALVNANQYVVARYLYDPFGGLVAQSGPWSDVNRLRFSSKEWHAASGTYGFGRRFYDPGLQRWLNPDPIGIAGGINLYGFVRNNPVGNVDPLGMAPWLIFDRDAWGQLFDDYGVACAYHRAFDPIEEFFFKDPKRGKDFGQFGLPAMLEKEGAGLGQGSDAMKALGVGLWEAAGLIAGAAPTAFRIAGLSGEALGAGAAVSSGPLRVTQYFDPRNGSFPVNGRFALSSEATLGNRLIDGITRPTTWVAPHASSEMSMFRRLMTGVGNRRNFVEFDALPDELATPSGLKSMLGRYQQVIPGQVDLTGRNAVFGTSGFNWLDAGVRYGVPAAGAAGGGYLLYNSSQ